MPSSGAAVRLYTRSRILEKKAFVKKNLTQFPWPWLDFFRGVGVPHGIFFFYIYWAFLLGGLGRGGRSTKENLTLIFFVENICFIETSWRQEKVASSPHVLLEIFLKLQNEF